MVEDRRSGPGSWVGPLDCLLSYPGKLTDRVVVDSESNGVWLVSWSAKNKQIPMWVTKKPVHDQLGVYLGGLLNKVSIACGAPSNKSLGLKLLQRRRERDVLCSQLIW